MACQERTVEELGRIPTSPGRQVDTAKRKAGVSMGRGTSDRLIVLGGRESRLQDELESKRAAGKGSTVGRIPQMKHVPH